MKSRLLVIACLAAAFCPVQARAEGPDAKDAKIVFDCLKTSEAKKRDQTNCIDVVAKPCIGDEGAASSRQVMDCLRREELVWDKILNDSFKTLREGLDDDQRVKLRDMQRSWIETRQRTCEFYYDYYEGTMANPMIASCTNRETARRALYLMGFADDFSQRVKN